MLLLIFSFVNKRTIINNRTKGYALITYNKEDYHEPTKPKITVKINSQHPAKHRDAT